MPIDRRAALADWQALAPKQRQLAWRAAAGTAVIEDRELARVVARYAATMRGQIPTRHLVAGLLVLVVWLILAVFLIVGGQPRTGIVVAAIGVLGAGIGIGALQFRQAGFDRLYLASVAVLAGTAPPADEVIVDDEVPDGPVSPDEPVSPDGPAATVTESADAPQTVAEAAASGTRPPVGAGDAGADAETAGGPDPAARREPAREPRPRRPRDLLTDPAPTFYPEAGPRAES